MPQYPGGGGTNIGATVAAQSIYVASDVAKHRIGDRIVLGERVFRYAHFVAASAAGLVCAPDQSLVGNGLLADACLTAATVAGDTVIKITDASVLDNVAVNMLRGGYIMLTDSAGTDQMYRIKSNTAVSSLIVEITIYDEVLGAQADATTGVQLILSPFRQLRPAAVGTDEAPSGVPLVAYSTTDDYGWIQTWGPCLVATIDDQTVGGMDLVLDDGDAGHVSGCDAVGDPRIGIGLTDVTSSGDTCICNLQLYP